MNTSPQNPVVQNTASAITHMDALATTPRCTHSANSERQVWHHQWSEDEARAVQIALAPRRPLLLRGEPGCGKTQLAKAVAQELGWEYLVEVVHPRMEPQDLIYRFDAVKRLAFAHTQATADQLGSLAFYEPGVLWKALDWGSAQKAGKRSDDKAAVDTKKETSCGTVVCIDEIDKADADVPNSLLEVFGERQISLPSPLPTLSWPQESKDNTPAQLPPVIILTTNEDRMLPAPFLRRCVVLTLKTESDNADWLVANRGQAHYTTEKSDQEARPYLSKELMKKAADLLVQDRAGFKAAQLPLPGVAEYLDLLCALHQLQSELKWDDTQIRERLDQLSRYVYRKHAGADLADEHQQWAEREAR